MARKRRLLALAAAWSVAWWGSPAGAVTQNAQVNANVVKPLVLASMQNLDLGTVTLKPGSWSGVSVAISRSGAFTCPTANMVCTGTVQVATYNVTGTNNQVVRISAPNVTLTNQSDSSKTLTLVVDNPGTVTIPNSGSKGSDFSLGGSISLSSTTASGTYQGTFNVTVDYQ